MGGVSAVGGGSAAVACGGLEWVEGWSMRIVADGRNHESYHMSVRIGRA